MSSIFPVDDRASLEAIARQGCQSVYVGENTVICRVLARYILFADGTDVGIMPHLCMNGYWEPWITLAIARLLKPGWRCLDVGANHGYYTLLMADGVGGGGRVMAFEPNPRLARLVERSLAVNGYGDRVEIRQMLLGDDVGAPGPLVIPRSHAMNASVYRQPVADDEVVEVESTTVDRATEGWPGVDFLKIDVEGAEEMVWRGMRRTVADNPGITIVMEVNMLRYADPAAFLHSIRDAGFPLRYIDYDASIRGISEERILSGPPGEEWMLFLRRS